MTNTLDTSSADIWRPYMGNLKRVLPLIKELMCANSTAEQSSPRTTAT